MKTATTQRTKIELQKEADWLYRLLADIQAEVASQPTHQAVARMRARLQAEMKEPIRAAA